MILDSHPEYRLEILTFEKLKSHLKLHSDSAFSETFRFREMQAMGADEHAAMKRLQKSQGEIYRLNVALFHGDEFAGWSYGWQSEFGTYYMTNSAVLPAHRRKGLYSAMLRYLLKVLKKEGFQIIYSRHTATNNAVLVPKLKAGFIISGMEISDSFGLLVHLRYYTNPTRREMMDVRSGQKRPEGDLRKLLGL